MTQTINTFPVSLPTNLREELDRVAKNTERSRDELATEAIKNYLDLYYWQAARIKERMELDKNGQTTYIDHEEAMAQVEVILNKQRQ